MALCFGLSMPGGNKKWTGEGRYAVVRSAGKREAAVLAGGPYHYHFGDGWVARVDVSEVKGNEITKARKRSKGFCGYEWMIDSIIRDLKIKGD
jgi:hypothetical protein